MKRSNLPTMFLLAGLAVVFKTDPANAYLDPGTASLVLQGIVGTVGAGIVAFGIYWRKFTGLFGKGETKGADIKSSDRSAGNHADRDDR